jgi:AcrR family transcriptional regulator
MAEGMKSGARVTRRAAGAGENAAVPPATSRRPRKRDAELLKAATEVFWRYGYPAATIQQVAEAMGVLKGSLYYYIESKEDLLFWIFDDTHAEAMRLMAEVAALDAPPLERLEVFIRRFVDFYLHNVERVTLYFRQWRYLSGDRRETVLKQRDKYDQFIIGMIREAQQMGHVPSDVRPRYIAFFILGAINGIPDWYRRDGRDSPERISATYAELAVRVVTDGVPAAASKPSS